MPVVPDLRRKGVVNLSKGILNQHGSDEVREREGRKPVADVTVAAVAALTTIMGREAIYQWRMVTWNELGVTV